MRDAKSSFPILALMFWGATAMAYEEPEYEVVSETDAYEIRRYESYIVAEVDVEGSFGSAGNKAFRILAGYIFGDNQPREKMKMTIPVTSTEKGEKMNMTVPVESKASGQSTYTYAFVMERKYTLDTLPKPDDSRIRLLLRPERFMAVNRYSGSNGERRYVKEETELLDALEQDGIDVIGTPIFARYNGPFTLPFLRRNEVLVEIAAPTN